MTIRESGYCAMGVAAGLILGTIMSGYWWAFLASLGLVSLYLLWVSNRTEADLTQYPTPQDYQKRHHTIRERQAEVERYRQSYPPIRGMLPPQYESPDVRVTFVRTPPTEQAGDFGRSTASTKGDSPASGNHGAIQ